MQTPDIAPALCSYCTLKHDIHIYWKPSHTSSTQQKKLPCSSRSRRLGTPSMQVPVHVPACASCTSRTSHHDTVHLCSRLKNNNNTNKHPPGLRPAATEVLLDRHCKKWHRSATRVPTQPQSGCFQVCAHLQHLDCQDLKS
jgi:hypothetical protein